MTILIGEKSLPNSCISGAANRQPSSSRLDSAETDHRFRAGLRPLSLELPHTNSINYFINHNSFFTPSSLVVCTCTQTFTINILMPNWTFITGSEAFLHLLSWPPTTPPHHCIAVSSLFTIPFNLSLSLSLSLSISVSHGLLISSWLGLWYPSTARI